MRTYRVLLIVAILTALPMSHAAVAQPYADGMEWFLTGDANGVDGRTIEDVVYLVNYHFKGGPAPTPTKMSGDANFDGILSISDALELVYFLYGTHPDPWSIFFAYTGPYYLDTSGLYEAQRIAMWFGDEVEPTDSLVIRMGSDLSRIRTKFGVANAGVCGAYFMLPWVPTDLLIFPDSATHSAIKDGTYQAWDSLNAAWGLQDTYLSGPWVWLRFDRSLNMRALSARYASLPGITHASVNHWLGDWPGVYPMAHGDTTSYLFRLGWGDCLAGCMYSRYWFAKATQERVWMVGSWDPDAVPDAPDWWPEAYQSVTYFRQH